MDNVAIVTRRAPDDPESLTEPLAERVRASYNSWACIRDARQFPPGVEDEMFRKIVWSVLLGLDETEFVLIHKSKAPLDALTVSGLVEEAARNRRYAQVMEAAGQLFPATDLERRLDGVLRATFADRAPAAIPRNADIFADLGADSLDCVELWMSLEAEFDVSISDNDAEQIKTVADAVRIIEGALQEKAA